MRNKGKDTLDKAKQNKTKNKERLTISSVGEDNKATLIHYCLTYECVKYLGVTLESNLRISFQVKYTFTIKSSNSITRYFNLYVYIY